MTLEQIRKNESNSHIKMYESGTLYEDGSWLNKPIKTVLDQFPYFDGHRQLHVLDLGCGIGRNCIAIARYFRHIPCVIDCVDILEIAIEKLRENADKYSISENICGIVKEIEDFQIPENHYDWIIAVSSLEHVVCKDTFIRKLQEIRKGVRENGIVCLVMNSNVMEFEKESGNPLPPQFEVNLPTDEVQMLLQTVFSEWDVLKSTVKKQYYEIPRETCIAELHTDVVTFVAKK